MRPQPAPGPWTYARMLAELPAESRYEVHGGVLLDMSPSPSYAHNRISRRLERALSRVVEAAGLGEVMHAPMDVELAPDEVVQPDLFVLLKNTQARVERHVVGPPDLVIEIVSPSSFHRDTVEKRDLYARFGVQEYWLVDPANQYIEVNMLANGRYEAHATATAVADEELPTEVTSALLPELVVRCAEIFT